MDKNAIRMVSTSFRCEPATPVESVDAEMNGIRYMGMAVGLLAAQVDEIVDVWTDWWGVGPQTHLDFSIISRSVAFRATGQAWRPGEMTT